MKRKLHAVKPIKFIKTPHTKAGKVRCYIYENRSLLDSFREDWLWLKDKRKLVTPLLQTSHLKRVAGLFPRKVRIEWVIIALLLGLLLAPKAYGKVIPDATPVLSPGGSLTHFTPKKPVEAPKIAHIANVALKPVPPPQPVYVAPVGVTNCGSDPNMAFIYQHESGCRTNAIGPNGPCGLGQALPCSKLPCSLSDWACQNAWFTAYAVRTYGSTYAAMLFWQSHSWW